MTIAWLEINMYYTIQPKENGFRVKKEILGKRIFYLEKNLSSYKDCEIYKIIN